MEGETETRCDEAGRGPLSIAGYKTDEECAGGSVRIRSFKWKVRFAPKTRFSKKPVNFDRIIKKPSESMEAHFVTCKSAAHLTAKSEKIAPNLPLQPAAPVKGPRGILSRFGSQAQAFFSPKKSRFGSSVAIHKLRETKWFRHDEQGILCAVLETGFVVEIKADTLAPEVEDGVVAPDYHCYGVAMWKKGKEKTKNAEHIEIYTLNEKSSRKRVYKTSLTSFWKKGTVIRINNVADKQEQPNSEKDMRSKLDTVIRSRYDRNWHNSLHFVHWCRYGETPEQARTRQINETLKWGNVGMNMGVLLIAHNQQRRHLQTV